MSIIERFSELLGSDSQPQQKQQTTGQIANNAAQDLIERAVGGSLLPEPADLKNRSADVLSVKHTHPVNRIARPYKIDRGRLQSQSMITPDGKRTATTEDFRRIKRQILANAATPRTDAPPANLVLVTSSVPGEGKTFCAINLAISIASEMDRTVLLVDADVAKPSVTQALGIDAEKGLMDVLLNREIDLAEVMCVTDIEKLTILPAGTVHQHANELFASGTMRALLQEFAERHHDRIILFDSSPLLAASEASALASQVGQVVVVVEAGRTSEATLKDALSRIDSSRVTGLLLNKGEDSKLAYGYGGYG